MKISKLLVISIIGVMLLTITPIHASTVNIVINQAPVQFTEQTGTPFIENNHTLVPMRVVMEQYGCIVTWSQSLQTATITKGNSEVKVPIGQNYILVNNDKQNVEVPAQVIKGKTYLPIRAVLEGVEADVKWDNNSKSVIVNSNKNDNKYKKIEVDGGDKSGYRQANVVVDIGFGDREYWAYTNEYGQLIKVTADKVIVQDDKNEPVKSNGRYYYDEAKVSGVESPNLDEGHVIADSLGGVSNAYNITPQNSTLNRHGDQAYMEKAIRDAGGCTDFEAIITYPDTTTQIPSHYHYTYILKGNMITDDFDNVNPDEINKTISEPIQSNSAQSSTSNETHDITSIDKNGNGQVTIKEAKNAGFKMPITKSHWLYQYMNDRDGDGIVGE